MRHNFKYTVLACYIYILPEFLLKCLNLLDCFLKTSLIAGHSDIIPHDKTKFLVE